MTGFVVERSNLRGVDGRATDARGMVLFRSFFIFDFKTEHKRIYVISPWCSLRLAPGTFLTPFDTPMLGSDARCQNREYHSEEFVSTQLSYSEKELLEMWHYIDASSFY
ncbi:hypothetical protein AVEN_224763-1 [Araneus ventricosus]|uniref:Uncharacterized protein n=1 Tax=Araneus ventricosus TaxID=182803 RepID=A0A4Y2GW15_ARAVE|nr:hypothetical protein AVEN_224763-1 [Araneus ventricosus]